MVNLYTIVRLLRIRININTIIEADKIWFQRKDNRDEKKCWYGGQADPYIGRHCDTVPDVYSEERAMVDRAFRAYPAVNRDIWLVPSLCVVSYQYE
jgi:hypothetical protein